MYTQRKILREQTKKTGNADNTTRDASNAEKPLNHYDRNYHADTGTH